MAGTSHESSSHEHFQHAPDQTLLEKQLNTGMTSVEKYSKQILVAFLLLIVAVAAVMLWQRSKQQRNNTAWTSFMQCKSPEDYLAVAEKHAGSPVGEWARLEAGKLFVSEGLSQAMTNREASDASLKNAQKSYEALLSKKIPPELRQEALYGLATSLEALSDGDNKSAIEAYETLLKEFPNNNHKLWAEARISELKSGSSQSFYAWFRKQNPKPAERPGPRDLPSLESLLPELNLPDVVEGTPPNATEKMLELPAKEGAPDLSLPAVPSPGQPAPADKAEMPAKPAADAKPAEPAKPAAEAKPATPPADAKPAEVKPAETKPAEAKPAAGQPEAPAKPAAPEGETKPAAESKPAAPEPAPEAKK